MQYFTRYGRLLLLGLGLTSALPALAAGTNAGVSVDNLVTLNYSVNGGAQPEQTDTVSFVVDRKLDLLVTRTDADWVTVTIGQPYAGQTGVPAVNYSITNNSNDPINVLVGVIDQAGLEIADLTDLPGTPGAFDSVSYIVAVSEDGNGTYDDGVDTIVPLTGGYYDLTAALGGQLAEDVSVDVMIVSNVPATAQAGDIEAWTLVAAAAEDQGSGVVPIGLDDSGHLSPGSSDTPDDVPNTLDGVETVFADTASGDADNLGYDFFAGSASTVDLDYDGQGSDSSGFVVTGVDLLVAKYAEVVYDPVSGNRYDALGAATGVEPKAIPGSVIMYVIGLANQDTVFSADDITVTDDIDVGPVVLGNATGDPVYNPVSVTVDLDTGAGTNNQTYTLPAALDIDEVYVEDCGGVGVGGAFSGSDPEVSAGPIDCGPTTSGYVVYFVTVEADG